MTDKVQKIREEVARLQDLTMDKNKDFYSEASAGEYYALCKIEHFIDSLQEEPVSEKKCMFTQDHFTEEDRKVLCEDCDEDCEYAKKVEPAEIDFEQELYKAFGQVKDFTLGMRIAKWFYDMGKNSQETVSEDLEKVADQYSQGIESDYTNDMFDRGDIYEAVIYGAQWQEHQDSRLYENTKKMWEEIDKQYDDGFATGQKLLREQMLKEAFEVPVVVSKIGEKIPSIAFGMPYSNYKDGDKVKLIIIKEDRL